MKGKTAPKILTLTIAAETRAKTKAFKIFLLCRNFIAQQMPIINKDINTMSLLLKKLSPKILGEMIKKLVPNKPVIFEL